MKIFYLRFSIGAVLVALILALVFKVLTAGEADKKNKYTASLHKTAGLPISTKFNINNLSMWVRADGWSARNPITGAAGLTFPRGTSAAIFQDGLIYGGLVQQYFGQFSA